MNHSKDTHTDKVFYVINITLVTLVFIIVLYPLVFVLSASVSDPAAVGQGRVVLWPVGFTLEGYKRVFLHEGIRTGYANTIFYTIVGTFINLMVTLPCAYALSKKSLPGKGLLMTLFVFTMYFSGGMIPTFLQVRNMGLYNSRTVMVVISALSVYNMIICRTFFANTPKELEESALIDGCSRTRTFIQIVIPLSKALLGVMVLRYGVEHWNSYFNALIYLYDNTKKPLQLFLREILVLEAMQSDMMTDLDVEYMQQKENLKHLLKYSVIIVSSLPVLILYPFLQKYFDKGILIGSLKG